MMQSMSKETLQMRLIKDLEIEYILNYLDETNVIKRVLINEREMQKDM